MWRLEYIIHQLELDQAAIKEQHGYDLQPVLDDLHQALKDIEKELNAYRSSGVRGVKQVSIGGKYQSSQPESVERIDTNCTQSVIVTGDGNAV